MGCFGYARNQASVNEDASLENDKLGMLIEVCLGEFTGLELTPRVQRYAEGLSRVESRDEAGHGGQAVAPTGVSKI